MVLFYAVIEFRIQEGLREENACLSDIRYLPDKAVVNDQLWMQE
jgi:hypothetical protein